MKSLLAAILWFWMASFALAEEVSFDFRLVPLVLPDGWIAVEFSGQSVTVKRKSGDEKTIKLSKAESDSLVNLIRKLNKEQLDGFWMSELLDGDVVAGYVKYGKRKYSFRGLNGCPPGIAVILMKLNSVTGDKLFSSHWKKREKESKHQDKDPFASPQLGGDGGKNTRRAKSEQGGDRKREQSR